MIRYQLMKVPIKRNKAGSTLCALCTSMSYSNAWNSLHTVHWDLKRDRQHSYQIYSQRWEISGMKDIPGKSELTSNCHWISLWESSFDWFVSSGGNLTFMDILPCIDEGQTSILFLDAPNPFRICFSGIEAVALPFLESPTKSCSAVKTGCMLIH